MILTLICFFNHLLRTFDLNSKSILLIDPLISKIIKVDVEASAIHLKALSIENYNYILLPVNDADSETNGTHWSLLLYNKLKNHFTHFDSLKNLNLKHALSLAKTYLMFYTEQIIVSLKVSLNLSPILMTAVFL